MDFTKIEQVEEKIKEHSVLLSQVPDNPTEEENEDEPTDKKSCLFLHLRHLLLPIYLLIVQYI